MTRHAKRARELRRFRTGAEAFLWSQLRGRSFKGLKFRRQYVLGAYIVDFVCLEKRLIIELDGGHHNTETNRQYDRARDRWLRSQGFCILRYWNNELFEEWEGIAEAIWNAAQVDPLTPSPSPARGEGRKGTNCRKGMPSTRQTVARGAAGVARGGYTLLELLLVIGILMIVAGAVAPSVMGMMADYHLKDGVQKVQAALAATRVHAIDATSTYQFRFEPGGRHFLAVPTDNDALNGGSALAANGQSLASGLFEAGLLPENISFQVSASQGLPPDEPPLAAGSDPGWTGALGRVPDAHDFAQVSWSDPIYFHTDGTAMDTTFIVVDSRGVGYRFTIRQVTGEIFVHRLEAESR